VFADLLLSTAYRHKHVTMVATRNLMCCKALRGKETREARRTFLPVAGVTAVRRPMRHRVPATFRISPMEGREMWTDLHATSF